MMVALNTTSYAANRLAGTPTPNLPSCLGCIIASLVGLRQSLASHHPSFYLCLDEEVLATDGHG
jgi:hypothetical protein